MCSAARECRSASTGVRSCCWWCWWFLLRSTEVPRCDVCWVVLCAVLSSPRAGVSPKALSIRRAHAGGSAIARVDGGAHQATSRWGGAAWSCPASVDRFRLGRSRCLSVLPFILYRRDIADRRVAPTRVVPAFDEGEHRSAGFVRTPEPTTVDQFALKRGEEALRDSVVVAITDRAHERANAGLLTTPTEAFNRLLSSAQKTGVATIH